MSGHSANVIKAGETSRISALFAHSEAEPIQNEHVEPDEPEQREADRLNAEIAALEAEIEGHKEALTAAYDEGFAAGRDAAEAEADDSRDKALELLRQGIEAAQDELKSALSVFESYALQVAAQALETLMGDTGGRRAIMAGAIARQAEALGKSAIVSIAVSRSDFPDSREVAQAVPALSDIETKIAVSDDLPPGRCDIQLKIGTAEIDIDRNWADISSILADTRDNGSDDAS